MEEVYVTPHPNIAQQFATYDGWMYEVEPSDDISLDFDAEDGTPISFICSTAKVIRCVW